MRSQTPVPRQRLRYDSARALKSASAAAGIDLRTPSCQDDLRSFRDYFHLAGTANGGLFALQCPDLQNYSHARAHKQPTLDVVAHGEGALSASADWIRYHSTGSAPGLTVTAEEVHQSSCILKLSIIPKLTQAGSYHICIIDGHEAGVAVESALSPRHEKG